MGIMQSQNKNQAHTSIVWKWENNKNDFLPYDVEINLLLERNYQEGKKDPIEIVSKEGMHYIVDIENMYQFNIKTKYKRKIIRENIFEKQSPFRWSFYNDANEREPYSSEISEKIEDHYQKKYTEPLTIYIQGRKYKIDTKNFVQKNALTGRPRKIERNSIPEAKYIWLWQKQSGSFVKFPSTESSIIENHFLTNCDVPLQIKNNQKVLSIELQNMFMKDNETGTIIPIRRAPENYIKYLWLWEDSDSRWNYFTPYHIEKIEENFQSEKQSPILIEINGHQFEVNTKDMYERSKLAGNYYRIRREAASNDRVQWVRILQDGTVDQLPVFLSNDIESRYMVEDFRPFDYKFQDKAYLVDLAKNEIRRSQKSYRLERKLLPNCYPSKLEILTKEEFCKIFKYLAQVGYLPDDWNSEQNDEILFVPASDSELCLISDRFYEYMNCEKYTLKEILRIQNATQANHYVLQRLNSQYFKNINEEPQLLFYISSDSNYDFLQKNSELPLERSKKLKSQYGEKIIFTKNPNFCSKMIPQDNKCLLLCSVTLGRSANICTTEDLKQYYKGKLKSLEEITKPPKGFDSIEGKVEEEDVYIVTNPEKCNPLYLISYNSQQSIYNSQIKVKAFGSQNKIYLLLMSVLCFKPIFQLAFMELSHFSLQICKDQTNLSQQNIYFIEKQQMLRKIFSDYNRNIGLSGILPLRYAFSSVQKFATMNPSTLSGEKPYKIQNRIGGVWKDSKNYKPIVDPLNGEKFLEVPEISTEEEIKEVIQSINKCSKSGLHNPLKNPERYLLYGDICRKLAAALYEPETEAFFVKLIQRIMPKSEPQARGELAVTRKMIENFSGDQVRFLIRSFGVPGDHTGQQSNGYRWPYGPVAIISPFNFPIEIPVLQTMGALFCGNKVLFKGDSKVSLIVEQFVRLMEHIGAPPTDLDFINADGPVMEQILLNSNIRMTQFTGSSNVANRLAEKLKGKIKVEDAGFDWKILGPDVKEFDYVAWTCDQDAYACSGQKCSAQSILFAHEKWIKAGLVQKLKDLAARRKLEDLTVGPILSWSNERIKAHIEKVLAIPGAQLEFGGKELTGHKIPSCYGAFEPTAIYVPLQEILSDKYFQLCTTELFGPFQIITSFNDGEVDAVLDCLERMDHHLTAGVVSNDPIFLNKILGHTVNGTTYAGLRARTTGAPQNHWFGPAGDPRGAGIGSPEAILNVWSCHREIIHDFGPIKPDWKIPPPS